MVTGTARLLMWCALLMGALPSSADDGCIKATEFEPRLCPTKLAAPRRVHIEKQGQACGGIEPLDSDCRRFQLSARTVRRYFSRAMRVPAEEGEHAVDRGPCWASGTVSFADGRRAWWRIEQVGTATLVFDGSNEAMTLYCNRCRFKPFVF
jgi:hypothetical protein